MISICPYYTSTTKVRGRHCIFKLDKKLSKQKNFLKESADCELYKDLEILSGFFGWCPSSNVVANFKQPPPTLKYEDMPLKFGAPLFGEAKASFKIKKKKGFNVAKDVIENLNKESRIFKYADLISLKYIDEYDSWLKLLTALKSEGEKAVAQYISQKSDKYSTSDFLMKWEQVDPTTISIGTLYY